MKKAGFLVLCHCGLSPQSRSNRLKSEYKMGRLIVEITLSSPRCRLGGRHDSKKVMKTKNLAIIFTSFLIITLASAEVVFLTNKKTENNSSNRTLINEAGDNQTTNLNVQNSNRKMDATEADKTPLNPPLQGGQISLKQEEAGETSPSLSLIRRGTEQEGMIRFSMVVDGIKLESRAPVDSTVYDLMNILKEKNKISFSGKNYPDLGFFVEEINGIKNNLLGKNWVYYINGQPARMGISNYKLKNNDIIEWKYEKKSF